jgi:hypothetical protein
MAAIRQLGAWSALSLLSALGVLAALLAFAASPNYSPMVEDEQFSSAMRGQSNGETGRDAAIVNSQDLSKI